MIELLLNVIARTIASLLALAFVAGTVAVLIARGADATLLDPLTYQLALAENDVYLDLPDLVASQSVQLRARLAEDAGGGEVGAAAFAALEPQDWKNLTTLLLPASTVQLATESTIDAAFAWLNQKRSNVTVDLRALKRNAAGRAGTQAVEILAGALPDCAEPGCPSPASIIANFDPATVLAAVPDEFTLTDASPEAADPDDPRKLLARARLALAYAPFALGLVLVVAALFGARTRAAWLRWTGVPLLFGGLIALGLGVTGHANFDGYWIEYAVQEIDDAASPAVLAKAHAVAGSVIDEFARRLEFLAGSVALVGLALTLLSLFVSTPPDRPRA